MKRALLGLVSLSLLAASPSLASPAFAHGGQYRGPAGEVPPDSRSPHDPPPPDSGGSVPTPPGGGGDTPTPPGNGGGDTPTPPGNEGENPSGPDTGGGGVPQPPDTGRGPTTTKRPAAKKTTSYESWRFWWNYNKDEILDLRGALRAGRGRTVTSLATVSGADGDNATAAQDITARTVETRVVPVLASYAENGKVNFDIQSAAVLGLAKIGRREYAGLMMKMARNDGAEQYHKVVEESAALALGILQDPSEGNRAFLRGLAADRAARDRTRCFAAFSLGLLGVEGGSDPATLEVLRSMVTGGDANSGIANSALVAMGLLGDPAAIPDLLRWISEERAGERKFDDTTLAYAVAALGKIGLPGASGPDSREVLDVVMDQLRRRNRMARYSAVIALGQIAPKASPALQAAYADTLVQVVRSEGKSGIDFQAVNFALVSLGRIGGIPAGADGRGGCPADVRTRAQNQLLESFTGSARTRPFAALGLGLLARDLTEPQKVPIADVVRNTLAKTSGDIEAKGALILCLGLLRDLSSTGSFQTILKDRGNSQELRGVAAVALGLIGEKGALPAIRDALAEKGEREIRTDAAVAAGLLGDREAVPALVAVLEDKKASQFVLGSVAIALGRIGDERALDPLVRILGQEDYPELTRALAAVALGQIGERGDVPVLSRVSRDVNYRAFYDAIGELLTII